VIGLPPTGHRPPPLRFPKGLAPLPYALDPYQVAARDWRKGEAVVGASAGSGKTTLLVERVLALLHEGESPEGILTLFRRTAATFRSGSRVG
jgi:hypothetical protein